MRQENGVGTMVTVSRSRPPPARVLQPPSPAKSGASKVTGWVLKICLMRVPACWVLASRREVHEPVYVFL